MTMNPSTSRTHRRLRELTRHLVATRTQMRFDPAGWSRYALQCKRIKAKLKIVAAWLHVQLWVAGYVSDPPKPNAKGYTLQQLEEALEEEGRVSWHELLDYELPSILREQSI